MAVSARPANNVPAPANFPLVELRSDLTISGGAFPFDNHDFSVNWHTHSMHQLAYAFEGAVEVEVTGTQFILPPQQAIWLPAGVPHRVRYRQVRTVSIFLDPLIGAFRDERAHILAAAPVIREMILYASRWRIDRERSDELADGYFRVLALLALEWIEQEQAFYLPTSDDPAVAAVLSYIDRHLADVTAEAVCAHVGLSERSLRRLFSSELGLTWREYIQRSRLLRSMVLLSSPRTGVLEAATTVGFHSASAFTRAFTRFTGESPSSYRQRASLDRLG